jgi:DNA ligase (NAD+)
MSLNGKHIVFTGTLQSMTRVEATKAAEAQGAEVHSGISNYTDILVVGAEPGSKVTRAKNRGIQILTEGDFLKEIKASAAAKKSPKETKEDLATRYEIPVRKLDLD